MSVIVSDSAILTHYYLFYPLWALRTDYHILQRISMICRLAVSENSFLPQAQEPHFYQTDTNITSYRNGFFLPFSSLCFNTTQLHNFCYFIYCTSHFPPLSADVLFSFIFFLSVKVTVKKKKKKKESKSQNPKENLFQTAENACQK